MKIELKENFRQQIEYGDLLIGSDEHFYMVCNIPDADFKASIIDLADGKEINAYKNLEILNQQCNIANSIKIERVIKSENLILKEV